MRRPFAAVLTLTVRTITRVRADVVAVTHTKQVPWSNSSLLGEVFLAGKP